MSEAPFTGGGKVVISCGCLSVILALFAVAIVVGGLLGTVAAVVKWMVS